MCEKNILLYYRNLGVNIFMWVSSRVTAVVPSTPEIHVPAVHTASSDVGIELPATWQHYQIPSQITPSFWHHGAHPSSPLSKPRLSSVTSISNFLSFSFNLFSKLLWYF